jgi:hypothetical protein
MIEYKSRRDEIIIENRNHVLKAKSRKPALPVEAGDDMIIDLSLVIRVV